MREYSRSSLPMTQITNDFYFIEALVTPGHSFLFWKNTNGSILENLGSYFQKTRQPISKTNNNSKTKAAVVPEVSRNERRQIYIQ